MFQWIVTDLYNSYFYVIADNSPVAMNTSISGSTSLVAVLKKKMLDTREEVEKVKDKIQNMETKMQVKLALSTGCWKYC